MPSDTISRRGAGRHALASLPWLSSRSPLIARHTAIDPAHAKMSNVLRVRLLGPKQRSNVASGGFSCSQCQEGRKTNAILSDPVQLHVRNVGKAH